MLRRFEEANTALSKELHAKEEEHHETREFGFSSLWYPGVEGIKSNAKPKNDEYVKKLEEMKECALKKAEADLHIDLRRRKTYDDDDACGPFQSEVTGVTWVERQRVWQARWTEIDGGVLRPKTKTFTVTRWGFEEAKWLASEFKRGQVDAITRFGVPEFAF